MDITGDPVSELLQRFWSGISYDSEVRSFATELVKGASEKLAEIDALIAEYSEHWDIDRMPAIDRSILRLAAHEILYRADIPPKATINEEQRSTIVDFCREEDIPILGEIPYNLEIYKAMVNRKTVLEHGIDELKAPLNEMWLKVKNLMQLKGK